MLVQVKKYKYVSKFYEIKMYFNISCNISLRVLQFYSPELRTQKATVTSIEASNQLPEKGKTYNIAF